MKKTFLFFLPVILILITGVFCKKLERPTPPPGQLSKVQLDVLTAIPMDYGKLTAVTAHAQYEGWAQLWFVDSLQTIRMVRVQFHTNRIHEQVLVIPRQ